MKMTLNNNITRFSSENPVDTRSRMLTGTDCLVAESPDCLRSLPVSGATYVTENFNPLPRGSKTSPMKHLLWLCGAAVLSFSCSGGDSSDSPTPTPPSPSPQLPLTVEVTSGTYTSTDGNSSPNHYPIELSEGDAIGLYVIHTDGSTSGPEKLTLTSEGSWPTTLEYSEGDLYFAYYPWQEAITAEVNTSATDDKTFFAQFIDSWNPATDQHDPENGLKASALMTATGTVTASENEATLKLQFTPRMAMVALAFPSTTYHFNNTPAIPDYVIPATDLVFEGFVPFAAEDGTYLYQVRPDETLTLQGSYNGDEHWSLEAMSTEGSCKRMEVAGGDLTIDHTLQAGDFFLANGHLLSKDADAAEVAAAEVIGVVFQIDPQRIGQADKEALGGTAHGQVLSSQIITYTDESSHLEWCTWGGNGDRDESSIGLKPIPDETGNLATNVRLANEAIDGYYYTSQIVKERATDLEKGLYPIFSEVLKFDQLAGGPQQGTLTTGWYLPAIGQWFDVIRNLGGYELALDSPDLTHYGGGTFYWKNSENIDILSSLNQAMAKIAASNKAEYDTQGTNLFWTSSILNNQAVHCLGINPRTEVEGMDMRVNILAGTKSNMYLTRLILTF